MGAVREAKLVRGARERRGLGVGGSRRPWWEAGRGGGGGTPRLSGPTVQSDYCSDPVEPESVRRSPSGSLQDRSLSLPSPRPSPAPTPPLPHPLPRPLLGSPCVRGLRAANRPSTQDRNAA